MRFHFFRWLRPKKSKPWIGPRRGIREGEIRVDAPPPTASDEQWLDFGAVSAMFSIYALGEEAWRERALRAYLAKWPVQRRPDRLRLDEAPPEGASADQWLDWIAAHAATLPEWRESGARAYQEKWLVPNVMARMERPNSVACPRCHAKPPVFSWGSMICGACGYNDLTDLCDGSCGPEGVFSSAESDPSVAYALGRHDERFHAQRAPVK